MIAVLYGCFFISTNGFLYYKIKSAQLPDARWQSLQTEYQLAEETLVQLETELERIQEEKKALHKLILWLLRQVQALYFARRYFAAKVCLRR